MALRNILSPANQVTNAAGRALDGGKVFLFEPGTTNFVSSFRDSGLVVPHTNPVRLSGSGRANIWVSRDVDMFITDRNSGDVTPTNIVVTSLRANPDTLGVDEAGGLVPNGSFETDADSNDVPDGWTETADVGSNNGLDTSQSTDGGQSFRFTSVGTGGGQLETTDFFPVNDSDNLRVNVDLRSTVATVRNIVRVRWFDVSQVFISNSDAYDSTSNPTTFTSQQLSIAPPPNARFAKLVLIGCDPSVAVAGSTFFDRVQVFYPAIVSGAFDNLLLSGNEIESTNTNGNINLNPNGTGVVRAQGNSAIALETATNGIRVKGSANDNPATPDTTTIQQSFVSADDNVYADVGFLAASANFSIVNRAHGSQVLLRSEDAGGVEQPLFQGDPDDAAILYYDGNDRAYTEANGFDVRRDDDLDTSLLQYQLSHDNGTLRALLGYTGDGNLRLRQLVEGSNLLLEAEDAGGTVQTLFEGDPDDHFTLYRDGTPILRATAAGTVAIRSLGSTDAEDRALEFHHQDGTLRGEVGFSSANTDLNLINRINGALVRMYANDAGGTLREMIRYDADNVVNLSNAGTFVARTDAAADGGFEVNNTLSGGGFERVLTEGDVKKGLADANINRNNTVTRTADPDLDVTVDVTGKYLITVGFQWQTLGAGGLSLEVAYSAANNTTALYVNDDDGNGSRINFDGGIYTFAGANSVGYVFIQGMADLTATGAVTVNWAQNVSNATVTQRQAGSYLRVEYLGPT